MRRRANDVDLKVAAAIRQRRIMAGLTQQQFAEMIGVTYQQAHKYETGINRLAAARLWRIGKALGCEIGDLFDGVEDDSAPVSVPGQRDVIALVRNYQRLGSRYKDAIRLLTSRLASDDVEYEQPARLYPGLSEAS